MDVTDLGSESDSTPDAGPEPLPDLTPRPRPDGDDAARRAGGKRTRNPAVYALLVLVVAAIGFVLYQGLSNAALYYRNADEAIAQKASLGTRRFRVQGTVASDPAPVKVGTETDFTIAFNNQAIPVHHVSGDPPELFKAGVPVVLEGHWDASGAFFTSDSILIKHSAEYKDEHPDRVNSTGP